ncbi:MAG: prepilin-type N-terminal cleavage/methylation domain-containing protein [Planctomycetota bacterium]|jgi:prepilin-type processing-associated H-X9-DG protein/prepilin-type N-terminal cleavage/methylation domain-containing protein
MNYSAQTRQIRQSRIDRADNGAFTLVELLVVIAIIALLMGILVPVLGRAKAIGYRIVCCGNLRQMQTCWQVYLDDWEGRVPLNTAGPDNSGAWYSDPNSWIGYSNALHDADTSGIKKGAFFTGSYNRSVELYHCPADKSRVRTAAGVELGMKRTRSYSMNANFGMPQWSRSEITSVTQIRQPGNIFVFLGEHEDLINDASFTVNRAPSEHWSNIPSDRHSHGCNFSFADGHVEHWRWKSRTERKQNSKAADEDLEDLRRLQRAAFR